MSSEKIYCAGTFKSEEQNGKPLFRCSGCKITHYASKEAQKEHWPAHKKCCASTTPQMVEFCDQMNLDHICYMLKETFFGGPTQRIQDVCNRLQKDAHPQPETAPSGLLGTILVTLFKRLETICTSDPQDFPTKMTLAYSVLFQHLKAAQLPYDQARILWSCPGVTSFMMGSIMKNTNLKVPDGWEERESFLPGVGCEWNPGMVFFIIMASFCRICVPHQEVRELHLEDEMIAAIYLSWWANSESRECIPMIYSRCDKSSVRNQYFFGMLTTAMNFWEAARPKYLAGVMTTYEVMSLLFQDHTFLTSLTLQELEILVGQLRHSQLPAHKKQAWDNFLPEQRLHVLGKYRLWKRSQSSLTHFKYFDLVNEIVDIVCGEKLSTFRPVYALAKSSKFVSKEILKLLKARHKKLRRGENSQNDIIDLF